MVEVNNSVLLEYFLGEKSQEDHSFIIDFFSRSTRALEHLTPLVPPLPSSFSRHTMLTNVGISNSDYRVARSGSGDPSEDEHRNKVLIFTSQLDAGLRLPFDPFFCRFLPFHLLSDIPGSLQCCDADNWLHSFVQEPKF